jgi:hypothetical protein
VWEHGDIVSDDARRPIMSYRQVRAKARKYVRENTKGWRLSAAMREHAEIHIAGALYELEVLREEANRGR